MALRGEPDLLVFRHLVRERASELGFRELGRTKLVTAASELARNTLLHGNGGKVVLEVLKERGRSGLRLTFEDRGPGIADIPQAMTDGFTTKGGMGMGLSGAKRLVSEFKIESKVGEGTRITVLQWV